jgi:hypothetical protein
MVCDEPLRGCLGLFTIMSWIDGRRLIWMQETFCNFDPITGNTKHVLVLRALMMHPHLFRPQHHQSKISGRIVHVQPPSFCASMSPTEVKATLIPLARQWPKALLLEQGDDGFAAADIAARAAIQVGTRDNGCGRSRGTRRRDANDLSSLGDEKRVTSRAMPDGESHLVRPVAPRQITLRSGR